MTDLSTHKDLAFKIFNDNKWFFKKTIKVKQDTITGKNYDSILGGWSAGGTFTSFRLPGEFPNALSRVYQCILDCHNHPYQTTRKPLTSRIEVREQERRFCSEETNTVTFDILFPNNATLDYGRLLVMQLKNTSMDVVDNLDSNPTLCLILEKAGLFARFNDVAMKNEFTVKELIPFAPKNTTRNNGYKHWISIGITYKKLKNKVKFKVNAGDKVNNIELHHTVTNNELHKDNLKFGLVHLRNKQAETISNVTAWYKNIRCLTRN